MPSWMTPTPARRHDHGQDQPDRRQRAGELAVDDVVATDGLGQQPRQRRSERSLLMASKPKAMPSNGPRKGIKVVTSGTAGSEEPTW